MVRLTVYDCLFAWGVDENSPNVNMGVGVATITEKKLSYTIKITNDVLFVVAKRHLTKTPDYKLLSDLNNHINVGAHKIEDREYRFEFAAGVYNFERNDARLEIFAKYIRRQAYQGFEILNTNSAQKRVLYLAAHTKNKDVEE